MPQLTVPGNQDVPLFDLVRRFFLPFRRYQRYIDGGLQPFYRKVVVTHPPFIPPSGERLKGIVGGAMRALDRLEAAGVDLLLAGHLHMAFGEDVPSRKASAKRTNESTWIEHERRTARPAPMMTA